MTSGMGDIRGVYQIKNIITNECYIGVSDRVFKRLKDHISFLSKGSHINKILEASWKKYGPEAFTFSCVESVAEAVALPVREIYWIQQTNALKSGFNRKTDQYKNRTLMSIGPDLRMELEKLELGSMNQTIEHLLEFYKSQSNT